MRFTIAFPHGIDYHNDKQLTTKSYMSNLIYWIVAKNKFFKNCGLFYRLLVVFFGLMSCDKINALALNKLPSKKYKYKKHLML